MGNLDNKFLESLTPQNVIDAFDILKNSKTDMIPTEDEDDIKLYPGSDDVTHDNFLKNIEHHISIICEKGRAGKYLFAPFKEHKIPKPPYAYIEEALEAGKKIGKEDKYIRVLSMSTIQDTLFQKLLADVLDKFAEDKFKENINLHSYGYRKHKSSKMAVRKIRRFIDDGYCYALDGDIRGFFDEINHLLLAERMNEFFGKENVLIHKFLYRFIHVRKILPDEMKLYRQNKDIARERLQGIPQGGVLSGLLANVFLYNFDLYVVNALMPKYEFKYFRYADDFVLLFKSKEHIHEVYKFIKHRLLHNDKLFLHEIGDKTKLLDLSPESNGYLDFLGFEISPGRLRIKRDNVRKFKNRIMQTLNMVEVDTLEGKLTWDEAYFRSAVKMVNHRIVGLEDIIEHDNGLCPNPTCKKLIAKRSWIGYFMMVTDVEQLREIDKIIRIAFCRDYKKRTKKHLRKSIMLKHTKTTGKPLKLITRTYYEYRKQVEKYGNKTCKCERRFDKETGTIRIMKSSER